MAPPEFVDAGEVNGIFREPLPKAMLPAHPLPLEPRGVAHPLQETSAAAHGHRARVPYFHGGSSSTRCFVLEQ